MGSSDDKIAITQRDIAEALGLSQSAVSHALKGSSKVSAETRKRVLDYAEKLGYRMDPALAALAAYRSGKRVAGFQGTVAWVTNFSTVDGWRLPPFIHYFHGAEKQLQRQGYSLDPVWMRQPGMSKKRFCEILKSRGIDCLLLCPQEFSETDLEHDFADFSVVTFGFSLRNPIFHNVTANGFASMRALCEGLENHGCHAIGFIYSTESERRSLGSWIGGVSAAQSLDPLSRKIPALAYDGNNIDLLRQWYETNRPDAVISIYPEPLEQLKSLGLSIPQDVNACLTVADQERGIGGMIFDHQRIGAIGARKLISLYHARERGIPINPEVTSIAGRFWPGKSVADRRMRTNPA